MNFDEKQISDLKSIAPNLSFAQEGGYEYILIENLKLPENCQPKTVDALLCPTQYLGYNSRLFLCTQISGCPTRNWNGNIRVLNRNWFAISWQVPKGFQLYEMLLKHLDAFKL